MLTVDVVVFCPLAEGLQILLIKRAGEPFAGSWALPVGFVEMAESIEAAAARELAEETGLECLDLVQFHTYDDPQRDPRGRVVSVGYYTYLPSGLSNAIRKGGDTKNAQWFPLNQLPDLAFDHQQIIEEAYQQFQEKLPDNYRTSEK